MTDREWFSNKELFEMINELKIQLTETTRLIKNYNGLREKQNEFDSRLLAVEKSQENNKENKKDRQWLLGWVVAAISLIYAIIKEVL